MSAKWRRGWSLLLTFAMLLGMMPVTAMATEDPYGVSAASKWGTGGNIYFTVDDGVLTWDDVPGATSYDLNIYMTGGLVKSVTGLESCSYDLEAMLDYYKKDSGTVEVHVNVWGGSVRGDTANFLYSSPYPKLEAPTTLYWGGNDTIADWDDVPHADGYMIYLYQSSGSGYNHWTAEESRFDFAAKGVTPGDGWYFKVMATSEGNYRNSEYNESRRVGNVSGDGVRAESKTGDNGMLTFTVNDAGVLSWTAAPEATCYDLIVRLNGSLFQSETVYSCNYDLQDKLNTYNADTGLVEIVVDPIGDVEYRDGALFLYSSPYVKLEAPVNLAWNGATATWDDVLHADGYTVYLYQSSGSAYNHWTTTNTSIDFSDEGVNPGDGWYFKVMATSDGDFRNSVYNESPRKSVYDGSQTFNIGAYAHDMTLGEEGGGEVYLETSNGYFDWSSEGYTEEVQAGAYVTIKAKPDDGYEFVEWRQGTGGDTISTNANYSFYCTGNQYLYAIFRRIGTIFPEGAGETEGNPAMCYSYDEFKYAMESPDIRYVALGNVDDVLPSIPHDEEQDPDGITTTAIVVRGHKDLNLLGNAVFRCPLTGNYDLKYYIQLLTLTDAADSSLYIHGDGSLTYEGGTLYFVNSAITVDGGHLTVDGATVRGSNGYHTGYCYGVNARRGSVSIQNGATIIGEVYGGDDGICALALGEEGENRSLSVSIFAGKFYVERDTGDGSVDHGITVWNDCGLRIYGMTSDGIKLGRDAADTLDDYVMDGCTMTVNGVKTDPATCGTTSGYVEVYTEISEVDIHVNSPVAGESPAMYPEDVYLVPEGVTVKDPVWYENGQPWNISYGSERFEAGSTYQVEITLVADEGVKFANPLTSATINYKNAEVSAFAGNAEKGITLTVDLGACSNTVSEVAVEIDPPSNNAAPDQYAVIMTDGYTQALNGVQWQASSDGSSWVVMGKNDKFTIGKHYRVYIDLAAADGYEFALDSRLDPAVFGTVNGKSADVFRYPEENPDELIFLRYDFGILNDVYIPEIRINDMIPPVAGETPSYTCTIGGNGYTINTAYSGGTTINGVFWYDMTDDVVMTPSRTFTLGNQYKVVIDVKTEDGFEFSTEKVGNSYRPAGSGFVNGNPATLGIQDDGRFEQNVQYTFTCGNQEISTVMLYDLEEPVGGNPPDTDVTSAYPAYYTVQSVTWTDIEGGAVGATFETGVPYQVRIVVKAEEQVYFADAPAVYIDGNQPYSNNVTVNQTKDAVTILYKFTNGASAPEAPPVSITWNDNACTVTLLQPGMYDQVLAAAYEGGKLADVAFLNAENNYIANLNGDEVRVFFLNNTYKPECDALLSVKP